METVPSEGRGGSSSEAPAHGGGKLAEPLRRQGQAVQSQDRVWWAVAGHRVAVCIYRIWSGSMSQGRSGESVGEINVDDLILGPLGRSGVLLSRGHPRGFLEGRLSSMEALAQLNVGCSLTCT